MSDSSWIINYPRFLLLALALVITFNLLPGPLAALAVALCLLAMLPGIGWAPLLVSLSLFGGIYFSLFNKFLGLGLTTFQIIVTGLMLLMIVVQVPGRIPAAVRRRFGNYLVWVGLVWILMIIGFLTGPRTEYPTYFISYFLVYATSFLTAGLIVVLYSVNIEDLVLPSLLFFSCLFPQIGITPLQMRTALDPQWGLRVFEAFTAITHARLAGFLFVMLLIGYSASARKLRALPELLLGALICLSVVWYSYTRQAVVSVILTALAVIVRRLFAGGLIRKSRQKAAVIFASGVLAGGILIWFFAAAPRMEAPRLAEGRTSAVDSDHLRLRAWGESWNAIKANPLFGYGTGWFAREYGREEFDWPHNWFIEVWLEHGLTGLLLFIIGAGLILRPLFSSGSEKSAPWSLAGLYWLIVVQLSGDIARNAVIFFFVTVCALTGSPGEESEKGERPYV